MEVKCLPLGDYQTNCYLAWGENGDDCIVIDPGYAPEAVLSEAQKWGKRISAILLTHGHFDHVGGVRELMEATGCAVYLHEAELSLPPSITDGALCYTDTYAEGSELRVADLTIRVLHTPGHTPGSVCLIAENILFSGDTLFLQSMGRTDLPGGSTKDMVQSLKRLSDLEEDYRVLPGHGPSTTLSAEKQYNPYLRG